MKYLLLTILLTGCANYTITKEQEEECAQLDQEIYNGQVDVQLPFYCQPYRYPQKDPKP